MDAAWLASATALELAERLHRREISAVELLRATLSAIAEVDATLHAFVEVDERQSLHAAAAADKRLRRGGQLPAFLGVPTAVKDNELVRFFHTRVGSRALKWVISPIDGKMARRCRAGGFVILGKTSTSELTILPFVDTDLGPPTRNPRALDYYSGGSSGGAAAAVAGGMLTIAPASDGAGSIRLPASFCGLVGVKPGRGALFNEHRSIDVADIAAVGPIAKTVRDAAAMMDVLDGHPILGAPESYLAATERAPSGLRIRFGVANHLTRVEPEIAAATRAAAKHLESLGHHVEEGPPPPTIDVDEFLPIMARLMANVPLPPFTSHLLQPTTRWMRRVGKRVTNREAVERQAVLQGRLDTWFADGDTDAWLLPTCGVPPPRVGQFAGLDGEATFRAVVPIGAFTAAFNVAGQPAVSLPAGVSSAGLPIGVQLVTKRGKDKTLLGLAAALERAMSASRADDLRRRSEP